MTDHKHNHPGQGELRSCGRTHHENVGNRQRRHVTKDVAPESLLGRGCTQSNSPWQCQFEPRWPPLAPTHDSIPCSYAFGV
jgi:hypothetical protein